MQLKALQGRLESIYEVELEHCIDDFLITDQKFVANITGSERAIREQVLVQKEGMDVWLSLYLDSGVYSRFSQHGTSDYLGRNQAMDFCLAAEGVSHFLYLCWNANFEREVTQLELELQAEVDKYLLLLDYVAKESRKHLHPWLFECWEFDEGLNAEEQNRYEKANQYASRYCMGLEQRYLRIGRTQEMIRELRRFYRKTQAQKMKMIDALPDVLKHKV